MTSSTCSTSSISRLHATASASALLPGSLLWHLPHTSSAVAHSDVRSHSTSRLRATASALALLPSSPPRHPLPHTSSLITGLVHPLLPPPPPTPPHGCMPWPWHRLCYPIPYHGTCYLTFPRWPCAPAFAATPHLQRPRAPAFTAPPPLQQPRAPAFAAPPPFQQPYALLFAATSALQRPHAAAFSTTHTFTARSRSRVHCQYLLSALTLRHAL